MKYKIKIVILLSFIHSLSFGQTMRYFEFSNKCDTDSRDCSFIVATSRQTLIDSVLQELAKPSGEKKSMILGKIAYENDGYNHSGSYWFNWHFIADQWRFADVSTEVCDGRPYTDVESDLKYWIEGVGIYCPWSSQVAREVGLPTEITNGTTSYAFTIVPNPASDYIQILTSNKSKISIEIYNSQGKTIMESSEFYADKSIDISSFANGIYYLKITDQASVSVRSFVVN